MSPVSFKRYRVTFVDYATYDISVEAVSEAAAIKKAKRIYNLGRFDQFDCVDHCAGDWKAVAFLSEVQS